MVFIKIRVGKWYELSHCRQGKVEKRGKMFMQVCPGDRAGIKPNFFNPWLMVLALDEKSDLISTPKWCSVTCSVFSRFCIFHHHPGGQIVLSITGRSLLACHLPWPWGIPPDLVNTDACSRERLAADGRITRAPFPWRAGPW